MWLIVGLANGPGFEASRHNVGWNFIDGLATRHGIGGETERDNARVLEGTIDERPVVLVKPLTLMNSSGEPVRVIAEHFGVQPANVVVIHDDMDYPPGEFRIKAKGGHGRHGGLRSLIDELGSGDFPRVRVGVGRPTAGESLYDYVLSAPSKQEAAQINQALTQAADAVTTIVVSGIEAAMNRFNRR